VLFLELGATDLRAVGGRLLLLLLRQRLHVPPVESSRPLWPPPTAANARVAVAVAVALPLPLPLDLELEQQRRLHARHQLVAGKVRRLEALPLAQVVVVDGLLPVGEDELGSRDTIAHTVATTLASRFRFRILASLLDCSYITNGAPVKCHPEIIENELSS
jgi:hypothetical protein